MTQQPTHQPQFFLTAAGKCPYLPGQYERKVFTHLIGDKAAKINDLLTQSGFRRSQNIAYRPACERCNACTSVRIVARDFVWDRSAKRILRNNADLIASVNPPESTLEQFALFRAYLDARHMDGGMSDMSVLDYAMMVEDTQVDTMVVEYRLPPSRERRADTGELIAVALTDRLEDGTSMVYSFYDPLQAKRSLGAFMILDHIRRAQSAGQPHVYLGYWVRGSRKMDYKIRYQPQEHLGPNGWERREAVTE